MPMPIPRIRTAALLAGAFVCASGALADRAQLPGDGSLGESYPLSLTRAAQWRAGAGALGETSGHGGSLLATCAPVLAPGTVAEAEFPVPPIPAHAAKWPDRLGIVAFDLLGATGPGGAALTCEVIGPDGKVLGTAQVATARIHAPGAGWSCDSEDPDEPFIAALDGNAKSLWHTNWHRPSKLPHFIQWSAGAATEIGGFTYTPRQDWRTGMVKGWELQATIDGAQWKTVAAGTLSYPNRDLSPKTVALEKPAQGLAFRFVAKSEATGNPDFASAAEFRFLGKDGQPLAPKTNAPHAPARAQRAHVVVASDTLAKLTPPLKDKDVHQSDRFEAAPADAREKGQYLRLRVTSTGAAPAVLGGIAFTRPPKKVERGMEVKGNSYGPFGPDYVVSGMTGLQGQAEHGDIGMPLLDPLPGSPAAQAGVKNGDYLVAVEGTPLRPHFAHQEMAWLVDGHPAALGRAVLDALRTDAPRPREVRVTVLRDGKPLDLALKLPGAAPQWKPSAPPSADAMLWQGPGLDDPIYAAMEKDCVATLEKRFHPDGAIDCDGIDYIQVSIIGLALLQTRDPRHAERIARCADWCLRQPELMNQWYWKVGYNGIFLAEYYLATGDERVRPWIENALRWLPLSTHIGANSEAAQSPGHGPENLPYDNKGLLAPALHPLLFEALAKHAGFAHPQRDFEAQLRRYINLAYSAPSRGGIGAMGYGPYGKPSASLNEPECWARTGLYHAAMTLRATPDNPWKDGAVAGAAMNAHSHWMYGSHAYGMPGALWGVAALAGYAPEHYEAVVRRHAWDWLSAWQPGYGLRASMPLMGRPYMGDEGLDNPAWLLALGARRHVLHLCGGRERNWLNLSKLPARAGNLRADVLADGHVRLECWPTGAPVRYTRNGKAPSPASPLGTDPDLDLGGLVLAQAFDGKQPVGSAKWIAVPPSKRAWRVVDATGWADPAECLARAQLAIDGKGNTQWLTNAGEKRQPFPLRLTVDLGGPTIAGALRFERANLGLVKVSVSDDGKTFAPLADYRWKRTGQADGNGTVTEMLPGAPRTFRYVRLDILETATDVPGKLGDPGISLGELGVVPPLPTVTLANGQAVLTAPPGCAILAVTGGRQAKAKHLLAPDKSGRRALPLKPGEILRARCKIGAWEGPEVRVEGK